MTRSGALIWADGAVADFASATMHVLAHGVQRGATVFDVMRVVEGDDGPCVLGLRPHVARFLHSMELMGMDRPYSVAELETAVATIVLANPGSQIVKLAASWTEVAPSAVPVSTRPSVWVAALPPAEVAPPSAVRLRTASAPKAPAALLPPSLKVAGGYTAGVREKMLAQAAGFDDALFRSLDGTLAEGVTQSAFVVSRSRLVLPPLDSVLDGITRRTVLDLAHDMGLTADIRAVGWDEVTAADELFLCSTNTPVLPVSQLDDRTIAAPGPITSQLANAVERLLANQHPLSARWLTPLAPISDPLPSSVAGPAR